jgi:hypothetical protein
MGSTLRINAALLDSARAAGFLVVVLANSDLLDTLRVERLRFPHPSFSDIGHLAVMRDCFRGRASLQMEVLALRHQLNVLKCSIKRLKLTASDRFFWACLAATWRSWRSTLIMVKPETVMDWHRKGFRLFGIGNCGMGASIAPG